LPAANTGGSDEQRRNQPGKVEHVHRVRRHGIERDRCGYRLRRDGVDDVGQPQRSKSHADAAQKDRRSPHR